MSELTKDVLVFANHLDYGQEQINYRTGGNSVFQVKMDLVVKISCQIRCL